MRQAGRYLPEYRELRGEYDFLELASDPQLIHEVSLQPWKRFGVDGVIVFSDILIPAAAMGNPISFEEGSGPRFEFAVRDEQALSRLKIPNIDKELDYIFDALEMLKKTLAEDAALIGFVGGPLTVASYLIEGGGGDLGVARNIVQKNPLFAQNIMNLVSELLAEFAAEQIRAGADMVQIFETWADHLNPHQYIETVLPMVKKIVVSIHKAGGASSLFIKKSKPFLSAMKMSGVNVASLGKDIRLGEGFENLGESIAIQGNLDPEILLGPKNEIQEKAFELIKEVDGRPGWIANLSHGVLPSTPVENVAAFINVFKDIR